MNHSKRFTGRLYDTIGSTSSFSACRLGNISLQAEVEYHKISGLIMILPVRTAVAQQSILGESVQHRNFLRVNMAPKITPSDNPSPKCVWSRSNDPPESPSLLPKSDWKHFTKTSTVRANNTHIHLYFLQEITRKENQIWKERKKLQTNHRSHFYTPLSPNHITMPHHCVSSRIQTWNVSETLRTTYERGDLYERVETVERLRAELNYILKEIPSASILPCWDLSNLQAECILQLS